MANWNHRDAEALYNVPGWSSGYFRINPSGHVEVLPDGPEGNGRIDLLHLVEEIRRRGVRTPLLVRFEGILRSRVRDLTSAFAQASEESGFRGGYRPVYPIKVNQERHVVEALLDEGRKHDMGLEVGSKPELLAVMTLDLGERPLVVCNGYKDAEYMEMALLARKLGIEAVVVIEKYGELDLVLQRARALGIEPCLGVRTKLGRAGSGRWRESGGDRSKFGLTTRDVVGMVERLREEGLLESLRLVHFHLGSQVTNIRAVKQALREAARTFSGLVELGAQPRYFDVGGGLGIDYDGSRTDFESSVNYSLQEYANDVVWSIHELCEELAIEAPTLLSESGRALVAHHALLVTDVLGVSDFTTVGIPEDAEPNEHEVVQEIAEICANVTSKNFQESFHDIREAREKAMLLFEVGQLSLTDRARVEEFYWRTSEKILRITRRLDYVPDDLASLERDLADVYFLNFSLFQSMPDSWAIRQLFPVLPIHRHDEEPTRRAVLADITCDSDGKIDRFIDLRDVKHVLELHPLVEGRPYYLGMFLIGAYQEILGDMHNLFGDTNIVHVELDDGGCPRLRRVVRGDRVQDALSYVDYDERTLLRDMRRQLEEALSQGRLSFEESALVMERFEKALAGYTYLNRELAPLPRLAPAGSQP